MYISIASDKGAQIKVLTYSGIVEYQMRHSTSEQIEAYHIISNASFIEKVLELLLIIERILHFKYFLEICLLDLHTKYQRHIITNNGRHTFHSLNQD